MASKPLVLPNRWTQQPQQPVRPDARFGATFAWLASSPGLDLVSGATQTALGVAAVNSQGLYRDLTGNAATQSFATPLPQAKYTIITVFVPRASVAVSMPVQTTTNGFRVDITTTAGGLNPYQATNKGVANGPGLVTSTVFDGGSWVGITTYDGTTMKSWIKKLGSAEFQTGSVVMGYAAPSGTLDIGGQQGIQAIVLTPNALPDAAVFDLLSNPWQLFQAPARRIWVAASAGTNTAVNPGVGTIALTGYAPTVAQSANQAVTPGAGSITITGYAPTVVQPHAVNPGAGSLTITGYAPSVVQASASQNILPGVGSLTITGYAPTVVQSGTTGSMIGGGGAGPSRRKLEDFLKSLEPKKRKKPRKKQRKPAAVVELAPFDPQELAFVEEPSAPPTDIELLLAQSMPVQVPQLYSAPAAIDQMLMQHRMRQQQQAQAEEDRIIELLLLM